MIHGISEYTLIQKYRQSRPVLAKVTDRGQARFQVVCVGIIPLFYPFYPTYLKMSASITISGTKINWIIQANFFTR
jgi:hypothetical protein